MDSESLNETLEDEDTMSQNISTLQKIYNFLFINKNSGNLAGKSMINSQTHEISFKHGHILSYFYFVDLYSEEMRTDGFKSANLLVSKKQNVRIIMCGGDGTIQWILEEAIKNKIDFDRIVFGVLPIGTGNDFSKSVGWSKIQFTGTLSQLRNLADYFCKCTTSYYDIWEVQINCLHQGSITQIKNGRQVNLLQKKLIKNFTNYFGFGTDARICYISQKLNPKGVTMKKIAYGFSGVLSFFSQCCPFLSNRAILKKKKIIQSQSLTLKNKFSESDFNDNIGHQGDAYEQINIGKFNQCITFLNSTSSMELQNIWGTPYQIQQNGKKEYKKQKVNDSMIEIVSYTNEVSLWAERCVHMAKRVEQSKGPFMLEFINPNSNDTNYIHINGEPYKIKNAQSIFIRQSSKVSNSKIKVLIYQNS